MKEIEQYNVENQIETTMPLHMSVPVGHVALSIHQSKYDIAKGRKTKGNVVGILRLGRTS